ncbi:uncharacterized protein LOC143192028 [Rhynchophorus ferrugineus]|uniref:uncharacterized protein LOC143192028 n=1 Tax=Rhynchophorus ferrugineus TaxID=354439 RepID=UPI003FCE1EBE
MIETNVLLALGTCIVYATASSYYIQPVDAVDLRKGSRENAATTNEESVIKEVSVKHQKNVTGDIKLYAQFDKSSEGHYISDLLNNTNKNYVSADDLTTLTNNEQNVPRTIEDNTHDIMSKFNKNSMSPYIMMPALVISGILPWILPGLKMAAGFVQMINQIAFMAGLMSLVRGFVFDQNPSEHVVYVNNGYHKNKH